MTAQADFAIKNQRRREQRQANPGAYRQGKANRTAFAWHGAFGTEVARVFNDCVLGTSGVARKDNKTADDYEAGEDYDG